MERNAPGSDLKNMAFICSCPCLCVSHGLVCVRVCAGGSESGKSARAGEGERLGERRMSGMESERA